MFYFVFVFCLGVYMGLGVLSHMSDILFLIILGDSFLVWGRGWGVGVLSLMSDSFFSWEGEWGRCVCYSDEAFFFEAGHVLLRNHS